MERVRRLFREGSQLLLIILLPAVRSVRQNVGLAALSVVLAFVLWIFVVDTAGGTTWIGTLPNVQVPVEVANVPRGLTVKGEISPVRVRVQVDEKVRDDLRSDDFTATVDLSEATEGENTVPVTVEAHTSQGRLEVLGGVGTVGTNVKVTLVPLFSKLVPVEVQLEGTLSAGLENGDPVSDPSTVTVSGTEELVALVSKAVTDVDVSSASDDIERSFELEARDERGLLVKGVTLDPSKAQVTVPIQRKLLTRVITVSPDVAGNPAPGYNVAGVSVTPAVVTVSGARELLDSLSVIRTEEVDITGASGNVSQRVRLQLPSGASVSGSVDVSVVVALEAASGQATFGVTPRVQGLAGGLKLAGTLASVEVTLSGPLPVLNGLTPQDLDVQVDLAGRSEGTHTVEVKVEPPAKTLLVSVTPPELPVTLQPKE
ncbi:MAG: hypothetical protein HYY03_06060 [Chloroflexi bacterium]|nr:hypothetical protein [Chloroflexota bacterium]